MESSNYMSDQELLVALGLLCCFLMIIIKLLDGKKSFLFHLITFLIYALPMAYGLTFKGEDGTSIVWFCLLLISFVVHIVIMIWYLIFRLIKTFRNRCRNKNKGN